MSHQIRYLTYHCSTSEKAILKDLNRFAFDPEETSGYHGNLKFHRDIICKNYDEAVEKLERHHEPEQRAFPVQGQHHFHLFQQRQAGGHGPGPGPDPPLR